MWWYHNTTENADAHLTHHSANIWGGKSKAATRWNEDKNRLWSDLIEPHRTTGPRPAIRPFKSDLNRPAQPHPVRIAPEDRQAMLRRSTTQIGNCAPTDENKTLWQRLDIPICIRGRWMSGKKDSVPFCQRPSIDSGVYCDVHSCTAIGPDGWRCANEVSDPSQSRYCDSGFHAETNRDDHLIAAIQQRAEELAVEQAARETELEELQRAAAFPEINLADYYITPVATPEMVHRSLETSQSSAASNDIRTPIRVNSDDIISNVEAWWQDKNCPVPSIDSPTLDTALTELHIVEVSTESSSGDVAEDVIRAETGLGLNLVIPSLAESTQCVPCLVNTGLGLNLNTACNAGPSDNEPTTPVAPGPIVIKVQPPVFSRGHSSGSSTARSPDTIIMRGFSIKSAGAEAVEEAQAHAPKGRHRDGRRYAQIMRERFGGGWVRKQAWGHDFYA